MLARTFITNSRISKAAGWPRIWPKANIWRSRLCVSRMDCFSWHEIPPDPIKTIFNKCYQMITRSTYLEGSFHRKSVHCRCTWCVQDPDADIHKRCLMLQPARDTQPPTFHFLQDSLRIRKLFQKWLVTTHTTARAHRQSWFTIIEVGTSYKEMSWCVQIEREREQDQDRSIYRPRLSSSLGQYGRDRRKAAYHSS